MIGITPLQNRCLSTIKDYMASHDGTAPSISEIMNVMGYGNGNRSNVQRLLRALRERGRIDWVPGKARSIRVLDEGRPILPPEILARLLVHCTRTGDQPEDVIADAVTLHLDHAEEAPSHE